MKVIIDIPDEMYEWVNDANKIFTDYGVNDFIDLVKNGTPIPIGHGKLKDTDKISDRLEQLRDSWNPYGNDYESGKYDGYDCALDEVMNARTIVEADKEGAIDESGN